MRSVGLAAAIGLLLMLAPVGASTDWALVVEAVRPSVVYVNTREGVCTGFVTDAARHYVLTAGHCDAGDDAGRVYVDRVIGRVVSKDTQKDLLLFEVPNLDPSRPALTLAAKDPQTGDEVMSIGYGDALERPFFRIGHVQDTAVSIPVEGIGGPFIGVDVPFVGGQSGGPVVNRKGEVVAIVQMASSKYGIGVGAAILRARMGRFFAQSGVKP